MGVDPEVDGEGMSNADADSSRLPRLDSEERDSTSKLYQSRIKANK